MELYNLHKFILFSFFFLFEQINGRMSTIINDGTFDRERVLRFTLSDSLVFDDNSIYFSKQPFNDVHCTLWQPSRKPQNYLAMPLASDRRTHTRKHAHISAKNGYAKLLNDHIQILDIIINRILLLSVRERVSDVGGDVSCICAQCVRLKEPPPVAVCSARSYIIHFRFCDFQANLMLDFRVYRRDAKYQWK